MVKDGFYYGAGMAMVAAVAWWLGGWPWAVAPVLLGIFLMQFFRDPDRVIPTVPGAIVSPADGKVTDVATMEVQGTARTRVSVFMNVFNVHVNRAPIAGTIEAVEYRRGKFLNAMAPACVDENEQNIVTVRGADETVIFKQIAGLIARRILFFKRVGDRVQRGERVGLIKFGSRVDVIMPAGAAVRVKIGDHVHAGSSILAQLPVAAADGTETLARPGAAVPQR